MIEIFHWTVVLFLVFCAWYLRNQKGNTIVPYIIAGLIIALLVSNASAQQSSTAFSIPNKQGGEIVITSRPCILNGKTMEGLNHAYTYWHGGFIRGCWAVLEDAVHIIWDDNSATRRVYPIADFKEKK